MKGLRLAKANEATDWINDHVNYSGDECLIWPFSRNWNGYGNIVWNKTSTKVHRVICVLAHGEPPTLQHQAAHSCGNGHLACVNQKHLSWKTRSENQLDRKKHGTHQGPFGPKGARTKLTADQIAEIRTTTGLTSMLELAERFGVKRGCIEYWRSHDRAPAPAGLSKCAIARRQRASASLSPAIRSN